MVRGDSAIRTTYRIFAALFIDARAEISIAESRANPYGVPAAPQATKPILESRAANRPHHQRSEHFTGPLQSVGATGGVYKGQGRSQRELMTRAY
ncbi:hypothetical protein IEQ34_026206 [Dendrobium chrysotoxum]|uniref:Uncharacterized protein n=1 Tax=Dendrobium chrysotoxum TaxID=161865 RepID=A0AAV7FN17_DENCH|nr:hypothetical protein IEQ34_026206 [Dendrobium chrysotoxum]